MDAQKIGNMVRFHRKKSGLSQIALAKLSGVGKTVVFDIEKGKSSVQINTLSKVLHTLNIKLVFTSPLMDLFEETFCLENVRRAKVKIDGVFAGYLEEIKRGEFYRFLYLSEYRGPSVSLTMPLSSRVYEYDKFPPFFEGLLPEGMMLESLLRQTKLDYDDLMSQIIIVGRNLVGNVTVEEE